MVVIKQLHAYEAIANTYDVHAINYAIGGKWGGVPLGAIPFPID